MDRNREALTGLCRELARFGFSVGMADSRPAIWVGGWGLTERLWVWVDAAGESFLWPRKDFGEHAVADPAGAAKQIADYLDGHDPDEKS